MMKRPIVATTLATAALFVSAGRSDAALAVVVTETPEGLRWEMSGSFATTSYTSGLTITGLGSRGDVALTYTPGTQRRPSRSTLSFTKDGSVDSLDPHKRVEQTFSTTIFLDPDSLLDSAVLGTHTESLVIGADDTATMFRWNISDSEITYTFANQLSTVTIDRVYFIEGASFADIGLKSTVELEEIYNYGGGNTIQFLTTVPVPEPGVVGLMAAVPATMAFRRRRTTGV
jgi:hypothetical protein